MRILCVYTTDVAIKAEGRAALMIPTDLPFGIAVIATALKSAGHNVEMLVLSRVIPYHGALAEALEGFRPGMVCFTSVSTQFDFVTELASLAKQTSPDIFAIAGGPHVTLNPDESISRQCLDAICVGEGDEAVVELADMLQAGDHPSGIPNLWIRTDAGIVEKNHTRPFISDLDSLPLIDRHLWDRWIVNKDGPVPVLIGRGCPNKCTYCSNHALARTSGGRYVRMRSPESVVAEIQGLHQWYPRSSLIYLEIETLGANHKYLFALCKALEGLNSQREKPLAFGVNYALTDRVVEDAVLLRDIFNAMKRANVKYLNVGLESGSERVRREVLKRPRYSNRNIISFCRMSREFGIDVRMQILMGIPGESHEDFLETVRIVRECQPALYYLNIFYPYPGTDLYMLAIEKGYLVQDKRVVERRATNLRMPGFTANQIRKEFILFYLKVYRGHKPWPTIAIYTAASFMQCFFPQFSNVLRGIKHKLNM